MEELIFVRRTTHSQLKTFSKPVIKLEYINGRFILSQKAASVLKVDHEDGVMFGFNQKTKTAYIMKDIEDDAFILKRKDQNTLRFTSKDLRQYFVDTFNLIDTGKTVFLFDVLPEPNDRGHFELTLQQKNL
jgi:hypothetical protein